MRAVFGVDPHAGGELVFKGEPLKITKPEDVIKAGFGFVIENRKTEGLILDFSILRNIALPSVDSFAKKAVSSILMFLIIFADKWQKRRKDQQPGPEAGALSGGNQQKVIAKWVGRHLEVIMDEPTRGIDVGAKRDISELMNELTASGVSIIMWFLRSCRRYWAGKTASSLSTKAALPANCCTMKQTRKNYDTVTGAGTK